LRNSSLSVILLNLGLHDDDDDDDDDDDCEQLPQFLHCITVHSF